MAEDKHIEIVLGNKNVAESGSTQVNITQNNFDPGKLRELVEGLGFRDEGTQGSGMKVSISPPGELFRLAQVLAESERYLAYVTEEDCMSHL